MNSDIREWKFRHYIANSLRLLPENKYLTSTLAEILNPPPESEMTGDEILEDLMNRAGLHFKED